MKAFADVVVGDKIQYGASLTSIFTRATSAAMFLRTNLCGIQKCPTVTITRRKRAYGTETVLSNRNGSLRRME